VYEWGKKFENWASRLSAADHPSRPHTAYTPVRMELAKQVIQENRRFTTDVVAVEFGISHGSAHHIIARCTPVPQSVCKMGAKTTHIRSEETA